jgi:hypothetical protein
MPGTAQQECRRTPQTKKPDTSQQEFRMPQSKKCRRASQSKNVAALGVVVMVLNPPRWPQADAKLAPSWPPDGPKMAPKCSKMTASWPQKGHKSSSACMNEGSAEWA